jgi:hypothetical protein
MEKNFGPISGHPFRMFDWIDEIREKKEVSGLLVLSGNLASIIINYMNYCLYDTQSICQLYIKSTDQTTGIMYIIL